MKKRKKFKLIRNFLILLILIGIYSLYSLFEIKNIMIITENKKLERLLQRKIKEFIGFNNNLILLNSSTLSNRLEQIRLIENVKIKKELPNTLIIQVRERKPQARLFFEESRSIKLIDKYGVILPKEATYSKKLPFIFGLKEEDVNNEKEKLLFALYLINMTQTLYPAIYSILTGININKTNKITLYLNNPFIKKVYFPFSNEDVVLAQKLNLLKIILIHFNKLGKPIEYLDIRYGNAVFKEIKKR